MTRKKVYSLQCLAVYSLLFALLAVYCSLYTLSFAQNGELEFTLDVNSSTIPLPKIFKPSVDLSGRGFHAQGCWPQTQAAKEVLDIWQKDIGFSGIYRIQYNLWEINNLAKDKDLQDKLLSNYEEIIKNITDAGGVVILDIFSTPAGLGKALDKKSPPWDLKAFKELIKHTIRTLSCQKKYNIWYEVWSTPDSDDFFLGRKQEYLNLYRAFAESISELEAETKIHIPLGGPSVSWWFSNVEENNIATPERSLIYDLIKFCSTYHLPLDFISWHGYSTDPQTEKETTIYNKTSVALIRDWLSYFNLDKNTPLIIDEWNFDRDANVLPERGERSYVGASYIPSRLKNMYEAGIDYQLYFCLEDFQNNQEGVVRNVGIFSFDSESAEYKGSPKAIYNIFRMLNNFKNEAFLSSLKFNDEFVGTIATKADDSITILIYNYIDPDIAINYLTKSIATLNNSERRILLSLINSDRFKKIIQHKLEIANLHASNKVKAVLKKAQELNDHAEKFSLQARDIKINIKNLKEDYLYRRYSTDASCSFNCAFFPVEEKVVSTQDVYQENLNLSPYSVQLIILQKKPKEMEKIPEVAPQQPQAEQPQAEKPALEQPQVESQPAAQPQAEKPLSEKPKEEQPSIEQSALKEKPEAETPSEQKPTQTTADK